MTASVMAPTSFDIQHFRNEVRKFCRTELSAAIREKCNRNQLLSKNEVVGWERKLADRGWYAAHWPKEYGGEDWSRWQRFVFMEAIELEAVPWLTPFGIDYVGPVIYTYGNEEQKRRWLPPILKCEHFWCQGFSEPGAGSDLASIRTKAKIDGDHYVVSGQKTWTTMAHWADMIFLLVRTSEAEKPQEGISLLLVDMNSPGITVRPITTIDLCHSVNEVFLDEVIVPRSNLVGAEGAAWRYAKFILNHERPLAIELGKAKRLMKKLARLMVELVGDKAAGINKDGLNRRIAELEIQIQTLEALAQRILSRPPAQDSNTEEAAMLKLRGSELQQAITEVCVEVLGYYGLAYQTDLLASDAEAYCHGIDISTGLVREYLHARATTIYGGSTEIQKNILAKVIFAQ